MILLSQAWVKYSNVIACLSAEAEKTISERLVISVNYMCTYQLVLTLTVTSWSHSATETAKI